ncbi:hypothetical protein GGR51DRAFT_531835 [Nemania sp. FL0031]|nr:hypothetical protein GGR51DRAFT_531835 [Nemania sp. FL0031]
MAIACVTYIQSVTLSVLALLSLSLCPSLSVYLSTYLSVCLALVRSLVNLVNLVMGHPGRALLVPNPSPSPRRRCMSDEIGLYLAYLLLVHIDIDIHAWPPCILIRLGSRRNSMGRRRPFHPSTSMYVYLFIIIMTVTMTVATAACAGGPTSWAP